MMIFIQMSFSSGVSVFSKSFLICSSVSLSLCECLGVLISEVYDALYMVALDVYGLWDGVVSDVYSS